MAIAIVLIPTLAVTGSLHLAGGRSASDLTPSPAAETVTEQTVDPQVLYWKAKAVKRLRLAQWFEQKRNDWKRTALSWKPRRKRHTYRSSKTPWYVSKQMWAGNILGRESSGDPWPNCPDPYDGGGSWQATVNCENGGSWLDSPGYYRCGLQFDPHWEIRFGRLCP